MAEPEINLSDSESWPIAPRPVLSVMTPVLFGRYVATQPQLATRLGIKQGGDRWNDGILPCPACDGEGYEWWK